MNKVVIAGFAALLGFASVSTYAKEVQLDDRDRVELRARADQLKHDGVNDRTTVRERMANMTHRAAAKTRHVAHKVKQKARHAKHRAKHRTT